MPGSDQAALGPEPAGVATASTPALPLELELGGGPAPDRPSTSGSSASAPSAAAPQALDPLLRAEQELKSAVKVCPSCCTKDGGRNLVVCIDGTSNQFSKKNTNVVELYSRLEKSDGQLTFYNSGIGTYAEPSWRSWSYYRQVLAHKLDLAFALRFERIIISAYAWLVDNYQEGDRIFLFGFSRGAYQVRALSAMIETVGILHKGNNDQIPFAYELYAASGHQKLPALLMNRLFKSTGVHYLVSRSEPLQHQLRGALSRLRPRKVEGDVAQHAAKDSEPGMFSALRWRRRLSGHFSNPETSKARAIPRPKPQSPGEPSHGDTQTLQQRFRDTFSRAVRVHFVGAWDTVSSVGFVRDKTLPMTTEGMGHVCYFRHALALHECRVKFLPEYANGGDGPSARATGGSQPHTKEVWFTGSHSDIGGGSSINTRLDKFGPSLRWMSFEATTFGLRVARKRNQWEAVRPSQSMSPVWRFIEGLPVKRLTYESQHSVTWRPHLSNERKMRPGQLMHQTVHEECDVGNLSHDMGTEPDEYTTAGTFILANPDALWERGQVLDRSNILALKRLLSSESGRHALIDRIYHISPSIDSTALFCWQRKQDPRAERFLNTLTSIHHSILNGEFRRVGELRQLSVVLGTSEPTEDRRVFPFGIRGHSAGVLSVAFVAPTLVVSGSWDQTLRIWDVETGEAVGDPAACYTGPIHCVALSPDGSTIASGSEDRMIRTWRLELNGRRLASTGVVMGVDGGVLSLAFSPDGARIAAGSRSGSISIWDATTGEQVGEVLQGPGGGVSSVAFCPADGARVLSGDEKLRVWDLQSWQQLGEEIPVNPADEVLAVAFSPDGATMAAGVSSGFTYAAGMRPGTVRVWDAQTREERHVLVGHTDWVWCIAFSPDGRHIASGAADNTVRIWDAATGDAVGVLRGHIFTVRSVAFSADGTKIVSGSLDGTVRVWDRIPMSDLCST
ncbi:WD40 repeat-like protein [Auricularia subglabra TFB-10046 SS5]|nr:WD40 repeat-like protein [Auricularia subglabra TFB-10046 SS5]